MVNNVRSSVERYPSVSRVIFQTSCKKFRVAQRFCQSCGARYSSTRVLSYLSLTPSLTGALPSWLHPAVSSQAPSTSRSQWRSDRVETPMPKGWKVAGQDWVSSACREYPACPLRKDPDRFKTFGIPSPVFLLLSFYIP